MKRFPLPALGLSLPLAITLTAAAEALPASPRAQTPTATPAASSGIQLPTLPGPVPVQLDASRTAFLVPDMVNRICNPDPRCTGAVPYIANGLAAARTAGVFVAYSTSLPANVLPDLAPARGDPIVSAHADKFYGDNLDDLLEQAGVTTLVITGTGTTGAVLYTSFAANARGYTVVVPEDGAVSHTDFQQLYSLFQMPNQPSFSNPDNTPLKPTAITLSRTDLIAYK